MTPSEVLEWRGCDGREGDVSMPAGRKVVSAMIATMLRQGAPSCVIAGTFGVNHATVSYWRKKLGYPHVDQREIDRGEVRRLHAERLTDQAIADRLGFARTSITKVRRRLGLKAHRHASVSFALKMREHFLRRTAAAGTRGLRAIYPEAYRTKSEAFARSYGLPADLLRVHVRLVVALVDGPQTARELSARLGRGKSGWRGFCTGRGGDSNHLTDLVTRGLVARLRQGVRILYLLTAEAMALLASAPKETT